MLNGALNKVLWWRTAGWNVSMLVDRVFSSVDFLFYVESPSSCVLPSTSCLCLFSRPCFICSSALVYVNLFVCIHPESPDVFCVCSSVLVRYWLHGFMILILPVAFFVTFVLKNCSCAAFKIQHFENTVEVHPFSDELQFKWRANQNSWDKINADYLLNTEPLTGTLHN